MPSMYCQCDVCKRSRQGAETTASEQAPAHRPHVTQTFATPYCDDGEQHNQDTDGHGESVDEMRRRLPDTAPTFADLELIRSAIEVDTRIDGRTANRILDALETDLDELRFRITPQGFNALTNGEA